MFFAVFLGCLFWFLLRFWVILGPTKVFLGDFLARDQCHPEMASFEGSVRARKPKEI